MEKIVLDNITINGSLIEYQYHYSDGLKSFFNGNSMFLEYEENMEGVSVSILTIPFVSCMAGLSWLTDSILFVDEIDETFYYAFKQIKNAYHELHHHMPLNGILIPSKIVSNEIEKSDKAILLFGGGVDCHTSFLRNQNSVTHVLNIYGWLKNPDEHNSVDLSDKEQTAAYASRMGVTPVHVRSNFASQFNLRNIDNSFKEHLKAEYWYGFLHPMAFISISFLLGWIKHISTTIIASSFTKGRTDVSCASFITTDSEFKFAKNGCTLHDGFELTRQDKVALLVEYQKKLGKPYFIQVCSFNDHNCCECEKCFRTTIELVAENADPRDFGFNYSEANSLKQHWETIVNRDIALWGVKKESYYYYQSAKRMKENYQQINDKEFVDWFLQFDFAKAKKQGLLNYYRNNIFKILRRKVFKK